MIAPATMIRRAAGGLWAMPVEYDPAAVTAEDTREDAAIQNPAIALRSIADASEQAWDGCLDTIDQSDEDRATRAVAAAWNAGDCWADALRLLDTRAAQTTDAVDDARQLLERARALAAEWGDDAREREALAMLAGA